MLQPCAQMATKGCHQPPVHIWSCQPQPTRQHPGANTASSRAWNFPDAWDTLFSHIGCTGHCDRQGRASVEYFLPNTWNILTISACSLSCKGPQYYRIKYFIDQAKNCLQTGFTPLFIYLRKSYTRNQYLKQTLVGLS